MEDLTIGLVCMHAEPGRINENLGTTARIARQAASKGAGIVCFPECSLTGYSLERQQVEKSALLLGEAEFLLKRVAEDSGVVILAGLAEKSEGAEPFISQMIVGPKGLIGVHRKTHLGPPEKGIYQAADSLETFCAGGAAVGIELCWETHFPEISTAMALGGAEILFCPHASPRGTGKEKLQSWLRHLPARAFDNGVYVVACNQVGETSAGYSFPGVAVVIGPDGRVDATYTGNEERILFASLQASKLINTRENRMAYFLPHRRPSLYELA
ncbi:MAG: nitrilase [Deltaproteobacteria bacterium]|nr:MAG: nitrilase [Deltaproteobacteria bacterium]